MKRIFYILVIALSIVTLSWFLPWLYSLTFPSATNDPFVGYSPVNNSFIVSQNGDTGLDIFDLSDDMTTPVNHYTKDQRDSLLPQIYFTQLIGKEKLPDTINDIAISVAALKHDQWVFTSVPRDLNKNLPKVNLLMESMPARFELEDPKEVFRLDGSIEIIDIAGNNIEEKKSQRFNELLEKSGFSYPARSLSSNITSRKPYDEGYLMVDNDGQIFHMKMQAGRPYLRKVQKPDSIEARHVFILENPDRRHLGLVVDTKNRLYALEKNGYRLVKLPVDQVDPLTDRITVMKNIFNWIVKINSGDSQRWYAFSSDNYTPLGVYSTTTTISTAEKIAQFAFPFTTTFTRTSDSLVKPVVDNFSWKSLLLNILLACIIFAKAQHYKSAKSLVTILFGLFSFIPLILINKQ